LVSALLKPVTFGKKKKRVGSSLDPANKPPLGGDRFYLAAELRAEKKGISKIQVFLRSDAQ
jgi:hypothetical protein